MPFSCRVLALTALFSLLFAAGCNTPQERVNNADPAPGVTFARTGTFQTIAVDLHTAAVRPIVAAANVTRVRNNFVGDAFVVREWCEKYGAIGGLNGGYFGDSYDDLGSRKQIIQLALVDGKVVAPGSDIASTRVPGERYLRSAVGFTADGTPEIAWATGTVKNVVRAYGSPTNPDRHKPWNNIQYAVACGPRLYAAGVRRVSDKEERLVDKDPSVRAFVAYDVDDDNKPLHFIMGRADVTTYAAVADFLAQFFQDHYKTTPEEAMCLDGGSSGQLVYKSGKDGSLVDAEPTGVRVPTAILLVPKK